MSLAEVDFVSLIQPIANDCHFPSTHIHRSSHMAGKKLALINILLPLPLMQTKVCRRAKWSEQRKCREIVIGWLGVSGNWAMRRRWLVSSLQPYSNSIASSLVFGRYVFTNAFAHRTLFNINAVDAVMKIKHASNFTKSLGISKHLAKTEFVRFSIEKWCFGMRTRYNRIAFIHEETLRLDTTDSP